MSKKSLAALLTLTAIATCCCLAILHWLATERSDGYEFVSTSDDPLISRLFRKDIRSGMGIDRVLTQFRPLRERRTGPYVVYQFAEDGFDWKTLTAKNGTLVSASVGSCTFSYVFFDEISVEQKTAISRANWIEDNAFKSPEHASELDLALDEQLAILDN